MVGRFATRVLGELRGKVLPALLLVSTVLPLAGAAPTVTPVYQRASGALLALAAGEPEATLPVIVQKQLGSSGLEEEVARLGGKVTTDLHIINAFAAEVPASAVAALGAAKGLYSLTLDGGVRQSGGPTTVTSWATDTAVPASAGIAAKFNPTPIRAGSYIWFSAVATINGAAKGTTVSFDKSQITFKAAGANYTVKTPAGNVTTGDTASTTYNEGTRSWNSSANAAGDVFVTGMAWAAPRDLPGGIDSLKWSGRYTADTAGVSVTWHWSAAVYSRFNTDYNKLNVQTQNAAKTKLASSGDRAGTPVSQKFSLLPGALSLGGTDFVGAPGNSQTLPAPAVFKSIRAITNSPHGPNSTFGVANNTATTFGGFSVEQTPGNIITKVEIALKAYVPTRLAATDSIVVTASCNGAMGASVKVPGAVFNSLVGANSAGLVVVDITSSRRWNWSDFVGCLQLKLDQTGFAKSSTVYYDAVGLRVSSNVGQDKSGKTSPVTPKGDSANGGSASTTSVNGGSASTNFASSAPVDASTLGNSYNRVVRATDVWNEAPGYLRGAGVTIAVVDSGVFGSDDLQGRIKAQVNFNQSLHESADQYGHGTFVANIASGDGTDSNGVYAGLAPESNIINVRVSDDIGMASESDVVNSLQWINDNKGAYGIKVVNMSLNSSQLVPYNQSPMAAAAEILWFNGITVVVAAGNNGTADLYPPANDPFVITVGASDDKKTDSLSDDVVASFSAYGVTSNGIAKPDLLAPGKDIVSYLPDNQSLTASRNHPANRVGGNYFRMSGTSMAAPIVAGAVAIVLQDEPNLTPDQVKYRLMTTANKTWANYIPAKAGAGVLDVYAAVHGTSTTAANTGMPASQLLWSGDDAANWNSVNWNSVNWNSVNWNSVNWNSVNWNSVNWNSTYWGP